MEWIFNLKVNRVNCSYRDIRGGKNDANTMYEEAIEGIRCG